ncbi:MAG TPA: lysophospholipid acyltransferase family protein [Gammaproteobacteria bacterium]
MNIEAENPSRFVLVLRAIPFWILFLINILIVGNIIVLCFWTPLSFRYKLKTLWIRINDFGMRFFCRLSYEVEGTHNIPEKPVIIFCKHQSTYETIVLADIFKPVAWVLKRELLWIPIFGWALALVAPTAIDRRAGGRAVDQVVKQGSRSLHEGRWVVIFPEGTRKAPGSPLNYRIGGAILASKSGYPVLPVAHNAGEFWPRSSLLIWPGKVKFSIGPLIYSENKKPEEIMQLAQDWTEGKMKEISDPRRWNR